MHHHGYLWTGPKERFDNEALRRPPHPDPPPAPVSDGDVHAERLLKRYRDVAAEFPASDLPPIETAYWLVKPRSLVRGSWDDTQEAAVWLGRRLTEYAPRFAAAAQRDAGRLTTLVASARKRLASGGDVSLGFYLERPSYLSLAIVTCSPHRERGELPCPLSA
ncbi:hypothetical protein [Streptomyces monashensis]|uniref:Uncharacterized protein n=1 Tax=Streptomyces monashensis TaxID=1678012 RepID=A0A1S2QF64_9ACTN|nr:hypothetical protein [Streptomyces monashensis]OIK03995.1 hypothetical protein BIV23_19295 [Streptomyces monashensis]